MKAIERMGRFAAFGVHAANDVVGECKPHRFLNDGPGSDGEVWADQPYQHTCMEQLVTDFGVSGKTTHPIRVDRERGKGRMGDVRKDIKNVVEECHNVQEIPLGLSNKYDNIMEGHRVIKKDHEIVIESLQKPTGNVLSTRFFPLIIT